MTRTTKSLLIFTSGLAVALCAACAQPPQTELGTAEEALTAARSAEAALYAPEAWDTAQKAMEAATTELAAQDAKFALVRSYAKSRELLAAAESAARTAERAAIEAREAARDAAETAIAAVKHELELASGTLAELEACPRRPKGFAQDLELLEGELQGMMDSLPDAEYAYSDGRFSDALNQAQALGAELTTFIQDLETAKSKIKC